MRLKNGPEVTIEFRDTRGFSTATFVQRETMAMRKFLFYIFDQNMMINYKISSKLHTKCCLHQ